MLMFPNISYPSGDVSGGRSVTILPHTGRSDSGRFNFFEAFLDFLLPVTRFWGVFTSIGETIFKLSRSLMNCSSQNFLKIVISTITLNMFSWMIYTTFPIQ